MSQTIDTMCGLGETPSSLLAAHTHLHQRLLSRTCNDYIVVAAAERETAGLGETHSGHGSNSQSGAYHGAGAVLHSRLAHTGWKFPLFLLTEKDERWLFDVEVHISNISQVLNSIAPLNTWLINYILGAHKTAA
jgi:hypothetical protein